MASIRARTNKDGSISYRAEIRIKRAGKIVWRESGTFLERNSPRPGP
jgi:hypothetical protein